jgi:outer membrane lipopolysaccharide assembly protein LptE/RlpB
MRGALQIGAGLLTMALLTAGCGYHQVGAASHIPANVRTLAVPIFVSKVQGFNTETAFTQAVVRELNTRTSYKVVTSGDGSSADAVLKGTIVTETVSPLTYDSSSGQTSSYLVTQDLTGFVQEDGAAVRRMGHDFAQALVSDMMESFR